MTRSKIPGAGDGERCERGDGRYVRPATASSLRLVRSSRYRECTSEFPEVPSLRMKVIDDQPCCKYASARAPKMKVRISLAKSIGVERSDDLHQSRHPLLQADNRVAQCDA